MDPEYNFTLTTEDQERFLKISAGSKYGELLNAIKVRAESANKIINFKEQSSSKFVLSLVNKHIMKSTITAFPIDLPLNSRSLYAFSETRQELQEEPNKIYDVRFIMPLIYHSVSPSLFVDCRDFIAKRCLALVLTGLSSDDPQMRALCYKILERYYEHLLSTLLIDKSLWINFLDLIRNSIPSPNAKLKCIFTTFLVKIIDILLHPDKDKMYELMKEFLSGRPRLRIDTIEIYDDLLLCSDVDLYNHNLRWLITLLRDGVRSKDDLKVLVDLNVIPQLMCLYNSELRFERANETICTLFIRVASISSGASLLVRGYSFLPWLHQVIIYHTNQELRDIKHDHKSESLGDSVRNVASLVFALIDSLLNKEIVLVAKSATNSSNSSEDLASSLPLPRLLELINVFIALHNLLIRAKCPSVLAYYLKYVMKVAKAIRKDARIPHPLNAQLLELIKAQMPYLC